MTAAMPSVLTSTTTERAPSPSAPASSGSPAATRRPASAAAPQGPTGTPAVCRSVSADRAWSSLTPTAASSPAEMTGQAISETVPQFKPAIAVGDEVSTVIGRPAASDAVTQAAVAGSTASRAGRSARAGDP